MIRTLVLGYLFLGLVYVTIQRKHISRICLEVIEDLGNDNTEICNGWTRKDLMVMFPWVVYVMLSVMIIGEWVTWIRWFAWDLYILYLKISFRYYKRRFYKRLKKLEHWVDYQLKKEETKE